MKRICWLTDIHLNFLLSEQVREFLLSLARLRADAVVVSGDIAEAHNVCDYLERMRELVGAPIYFVLGNHDFYRGSIVDVRRRATELCAVQSGLAYLTASDVILLSPRTTLVGHDGWADGREGDYAGSLVSMMDYTLIAELSNLTKTARWNVLKSLGDEAAEHARRVLPMAFDQSDQALFVTHVPPLREACWYEGRHSDDHWAPHFTCRALGDALIELMRARPEKKLTVLCGHTHGQGQCQPLPNLTIFTGGAEYGQPAVQRMLDVD
jgi:3',5'-cyclic-AMP phosphodiesterase